MRHVDAGERAGAEVVRAVRFAFKLVSITLGKEVEGERARGEGSTGFVVLSVPVGVAGDVLPYLFLTHALGASKVSRALDLAAARRILAESAGAGGRWDLVYVDGKKKAAEKLLLEGGTCNANDEGRSGELRTRIVVNEDVVQSLISGQLLEDD